MSLSKYSDLNSLQTVFATQEEIILLEKSLLDLRLRRNTKKASNPHLFMAGKRRLAQLKFKKSVLLKQTKD
jgi:ribosomal protein L29